MSGGLATGVRRVDGVADFNAIARLFGADSGAHVEPNRESGARLGTRFFRERLFLRTFLVGARGFEPPTPSLPD